MFDQLRRKCLANADNSVGRPKGQAVHLVVESELEVGRRVTVLECEPRAPRS